MNLNCALDRHVFDHRRFFSCKNHQFAEKHPQVTIIRKRNFRRKCKNAWNSIVFEEQGEL